MADKTPLHLSWREFFGSDSEVELFRHPPQMETARLTLRPFRLRDASDVYVWSHDPEVARYVLWEPHSSVRESKNWIRWMKRMYREAQPASWAVVLKDSGRVIGSIGFMWFNRDYHSAEVGYSIARDCWGRGIATEALACIVKYGFETLRLHRIEAQHDTRNPASGRVMEKCGFHREGILRDRIFNKGEYIDVALWAIIHG